MFDVCTIVTYSVVLCVNSLCTIVRYSYIECVNLHHWNKVDQTLCISSYLSNYYYAQYNKSCGYSSCHCMLLKLKYVQASHPEG